MRHSEWIAVSRKLNFRMEDDMLGELRGQAKKKNVSMNELIRTYIEWGFEADDDEPVRVTTKHLSRSQSRRLARNGDYGV